MDTLIRDQAVSDASGWRSLVGRAGASEAVLLAVAALILRDLEAAAVTAGLVVALGLLRFRSGVLGAAGVGLLSVSVAFFMGAGAVSNLKYGEGFWQTALPLTLTIAALTAVIGSAAILLRRGARAAALVQAVAVIALATALVVSALGVGSGIEVRPGDLQVVTEDVRFSDTTLEAPSGEVGVVVANKDLFWHTFTIKELDVNLNVPVGGTRRATFEAEPGSYTFVCAIPGHTQAGMKGTLTVG